MSIDAAAASPAVSEQGTLSVSRRSDRSKQTTIMIAIISAVVLFFAGLGLGFLVGHNSVTVRRMNSSLFGGQGGFRQRTYQNNNQNGSSSSNNQILPQTQTN